MPSLIAPAIRRLQSPGVLVAQWHVSLVLLEVVLTGPDKVRSEISAAVEACSTPPRSGAVGTAIATPLRSVMRSHPPCLRAPCHHSSWPADTGSMTYLSFLSLSPMELSLFRRRSRPLSFLRALAVALS